MKKRFNLKKVLIGLLIALIALGLIKYLFHFMSSPSVGTVTISRTGSNEQVLKEDTNYTSLNGDYYTLLYPSDLTADFPDVKPSGGIAYNFLSIRNAKHELKNSLEVYLKDLPQGGITLNDDYKNYQSQPKLYKLSNTYIQGELVDVATRNSGTPERGALWVHGKYIMVLKLKGDDKKELDSQFKTILKSVQWLKS